MIRSLATSLGLLLVLEGCGDDQTSPASGAGVGGTDESSSTMGDATTGPATGTSSVTSGADASSSGPGSSTSSTGSDSDPGPGTAGAWQPFASLPAPRQETAVVAAGGRMLVMGGFVGGQNVDTVEIYDPQTDAWSDGPALPDSMHHINAAGVEGDVYVAGFLQTLQFEPDGRMFVLEDGATEWTEGTPLPVGREVGASGVAVAGDRLYVYGGLQGSQPVAAAQYYDLTGDQGWVVIANLPSARDHMVGAAVDGQVFAVGGRGGGIGAHSTQVLRYDPDANVWDPVAPMPTSRGGMAGAAVNGWIFVAGGEGNEAERSGVFEVFEAYDPAADQWHTLDPMLTPRHGMGAAAIDGRLYVPGGATVQAFGPTEVCEVWVPDPSSP